MIRRPVHVRKLIGALLVVFLGIPLAACACSGHSCCTPARSCCAPPEERGPAPVVSEAPPPLATALPTRVSLAEARPSLGEYPTETYSFSMRLGLVAPRSVGRAPPSTGTA